jgi:CDP-glucose 4,6-dehydratase
MPGSDFWRGKRVLLTGHTGFKGAWAWAWLTRMGAEVTGFALAPGTSPNLSVLLRIADHPRSILGDIRDGTALAAAVARVRPQVVLHMAAQALVRRSYAAPIETFDVNVNGTLRVLEALRGSPGLQATLVITSDKVYENDGSGRFFTEEDRLGGADPYSASKAACEIAVSSFARSFGRELGGPVATARAGNVIGGGDWSADRIVPDLWRAQRSGVPVALRYPEATRPWQHVLEPIAGYLDYAEALAAGTVEARALNFGPPDERPVPVRAVAEAFQAAYGAPGAGGWSQAPGEHSKEAPTLAIDARRAAALLPWRPRLAARDAIIWTARWYAAFDQGTDMRGFTDAQIAEFEDRRP